MPHTTTRRRVSRAFWGARTAGETGRARRESEPIRIRPYGWTASVVAERAPDCTARVVEITDTLIRLIVPVEVRRGSGLSIRIVHPQLQETVLLSAIVATVTPPPPVASSWVLAADLIDVHREDALKLARWSMHS